jgi:hypothetical protein
MHGWICSFKNHIWLKKPKIYFNTKVYFPSTFQFFSFICQMCGMVIPIVGKLTKLKSNRITILEKRIKWLENYSRGNINRPSYINEVKALKQELADLLEQDAKADKIRSLPLYSCRITGWKFVCSKCC